MLLFMGSIVCLFLGMRNKFSIGAKEVDQIAQNKTVSPWLYPFLPCPFGNPALRRNSEEGLYDTHASMWEESPHLSPCVPFTLTCDHTHNTSDTRRVRYFPHTRPFTTTPSWVSSHSTQFWCYLPRAHVTCHRLRGRSQEVAPRQMPVSRNRLCTVSALPLTTRRTQGHLLTFTGLLKEMTKDTDEWPHEEMCRVRSGRVSSTGASVSVELGCVIPLAQAHVHQPGGSPNSILMEAPSRRHDLASTPAPLPFLEDGVVGSWKVQASNHGLVLAVTSPIQEPSQSHLNKTKDAPVTQKGARDLGAQGRERGAKDEILEQKMPLVLFPLRNLRGFQKLCARSQDQSPIEFFKSFRKLLPWVENPGRFPHITSLNPQTSYKERMLRWGSKSCPFQHVTLVSGVSLSLDIVRFILRAVKIKPLNYMW